MWDAGFGSPFGEGDDGFGSGLEDMGYGSPFSFEFGAVIVLQTPGLSLVPSPRQAVTNYGEEGGYLITLGATSALFADDGDYRVDMIDDVGQVYPQTEPGCYSALEGKAYACEGIAAGRLLQFALPPLPLGTYDIRITNPSGVSLSIPAAITVVRQPMSYEVDAIRSRLPSTVYTAKGEPPIVRTVS